MKIIMILTSRKIVAGGHDWSILDKGGLLIENGLIKVVGKSDEIKKLFPHHKVLELKNAVLIPGLVNVHTHLELPGLLDEIRAETFSGWILNLIKAKKKMDKNDIHTIVKKNIATLIETGTTTVGEICTQGISRDLLRKSGLRSVVFHEIIAMDSTFPIQSCGSFVRHPASLMGLGLSPHSPYTVSTTILKKINEMANQRRLRLCMHVAESKDELRLLHRKKSGLEKLYQFAHWDLSRVPEGTSSFEYLNRIGLLSPRLLAVHAVQVTDCDIQLIRNTKTSVAHCPRSNRELGVGKMPLKRMLDAGISIGLGTDSLASSPSLNTWDEMRYARQLHRRDGVTAQDIFRLATIGGAKALDLDKEIGTIEPGKKADIIAVPLPSKNTGNLYSDLIEETQSCMVTMVRGKVLHRFLGEEK